MTAIPAQLSYAATPADGTAMVAAEVRNPLASILTTVNSLLNIFGGGVSGQTFRANSTSDVGWSNSGLTYRKTSSKTVNNTVTETDLLNGEITIAAGVLGTTGMLRCTFFLDFSNASGGNSTTQFKIKLGGTLVFDSGAVTLPNQGAGTRSGMLLSFEMLNTGAAATNVCKVRFALPAVALFGSGQLGASNPTDIGTGEKWTIIEGAGATTIDTSTSKTFVATVTHGAAAATIETKLYGAVIEVI